MKGDSMNLMNMMGNPMLRQAMGAMMRGESPQAFLKNLANTNPQLQGLNFDDLEGTAKTLCEKNNVNMNELADKIREFANSNII
jgi:hypothetical protein